MVSPVGLPVMPQVDARVCDVPLSITVVTATRTFGFGQTETYLRWTVAGQGTCTPDLQGATVARVSATGASPVCVAGRPVEGFVVSFGQTTDLSLSVTERLSNAAGRVTSTQSVIWFSPNVVVANPVPSGKGDGEVSGYVFPVATPFEIQAASVNGSGVLFANIFGKCPTSGQPFPGRAVYAEAVRG